MNTVWNPNDLFNQYNYFDFDYEERPGSDAVRFTRYLGYNSRIEAAAALDFANQLTAAALYQFGVGTYDMQVAGGWFKEDIALGGGWAGNVHNAGSKGEFTYFHGMRNESPNAFLISFTLDYAFANSLYIAGSYLYNSGGSHEPDFADFGSVSGPGVVLSAKHPFFLKKHRFRFRKLPADPTLASGCEPDAHHKFWQLHFNSRHQLQHYARSGCPAPWTDLFWQPALLIASSSAGS